MIQQEKIKKVSRQFCVLFGVSFALIPLVIQGAQLNLTSSAKEISINQQFQVDLMLDTEDEDINAVEGTVLFPDNILKLENINEANSILIFWPEKPRLYDRNKIKFAGITPGGYQEKTGLLFSIKFLAKKEGAGLIEIKDSRVLLNDGRGTPVSVKLSPFQFSISQEAPLAPPIVETIKDIEPPEDFKPEIAKDPNIFEGKWFLVFASQDKGSGLLRYEVAEERAKPPRNKTPNYAKMKWVMAESPYVLKDEKLRSFVYVKAVDKAGNERIAVVEPRYPLKWYEYPEVWSIIILGVIILYIVGKVLWKK